MLTEPSKEAAAKSAGVSISTLRRYMNDSEFMEAYREAGQSLVADACMQAKKGISPALDTLLEVMNDKRTNSQSRIYAARSILEFSMKLSERIDVLDRICAIEEFMSEANL